jgi:hypothetical protein
MGIRLSIEIVSPLGPEDKDLQTGVSIMTPAIAAHELARERFPGTFPDDEAEDAVGAMPCMVERDGRHCIGELGHQGRHTYRRILPPTEGLD